MAEINPALTKEEWRTWTTEGYVSDERGNMIFHSKGIGFRGLPRISVNVAPMDIEAHGCAAVCLHNQPYGFTWDHAEAIAEMMCQYLDYTQGRDNHNQSMLDRVKEAHDCISALLPPRE